MIGRLEKLKQKQQQLSAQIQKMEAVEKAKERKRETRRKILIGAYFLSKAREENTMATLTQQVDAYLKRNIDRALFDLPVVTEESV